MNYFKYTCIKVLLVLSFLEFLSCFVAKKYQKDERVSLYVNKVGPYYNPHETYFYYTLPVCRPDKVDFKELSLGEVLDGDRLVESLYQIKFLENSHNQVLCHKKLNNNDIKKLINAIEELYYFEFVLDTNIPIRAFVGNLEESKMLPHSHKALLYTHLVFEIQYNGDNVVYGSVFTTQKDPIDLMRYQNRKSLDVTFTYSVFWLASSVKAAQRNTLVLSNQFFPRALEIHWISITNSLVLVLLLLTFIMFIIGRIIRRDFARYNEKSIPNSMTEEEDLEEKGWKIVHSEVFRPPMKWRLLFCAIIGTGSQMLSIAIGLVILAMLNVFEVHHHGIINSSAFILYSLTSCISGFVGTRLNKLLDNTHPVDIVGAHRTVMTGNASSSSDKWVRVVNLVCALFTVPLVLVWLLCDCVSAMYGTTHSLPFSTIAILSVIWLFVGYPLTILGGMLGRRTEKRLDPSGCRVRNIPREIPSVPWYKSRFVYFTVGGFLPFSSICIELYYIFSTVWGRAHYNLYGIIFIVFMILIVVTICVAISLVYFQLVIEDYRWWWGSIQLGLSSATFVMLYCVYHYFQRSKMSGILQTVEYFAYSLLICYGFFLAISSISFFTSLFFVLFMYRNIKLD